ncbi:MAG TPA: SDR family oxidoreductase [Thermoplasmata archaeon]|nr:SDR family oxidoreductase [Thermoplasmata archaeon]
MVVLVTGGAGYLGSLLIRELPKSKAFAGDSIRVLDTMLRERYVSLWSLPKGARYEFLEGDVRNSDDVRRALADVDVVFSLSDITNAAISFDRKELTWDTNHKGVLNLFTRALNAGVRKFVYTSTCSVYGPTASVVTEDAECNPASPYAESKLAAEREMHTRAAAGGFDWTALRLGTVFGWTIGMRFDTIVNRFTYLAAQGRPLTVYDTAWQEKRPYVAAKDVIQAYRIAATEAKAKGQVFNVLHENSNMETIIGAIRTVFSFVDVTTTKTPSLNQLSYEVDGSRFRALGFRPKVGIVEGIRELAQKFEGVRPVRVPRATLEA